MWLLGRFAATGSSAATYQQAEEPVSQLINDFGLSLASSSATRQRAAMPFVHLERELWDPRDTAGQEIGPGAPSAAPGSWIARHRPPAATRRGHPLRPKTLAAATRLLLDLHFPRS